MQTMDDKARLEDSLASEKLATATYNSYANECANLQLKADFVNILKEVHDIQFEIFNEMSMRGWYQVEPADAQKIAQAKQKYSNMQ